MRRLAVGTFFGFACAFVAAAALSAAPPAGAADRDCDDFDTQRQAQNHFQNRGGPGSDPDRLDGDGDGRACDTLPCPCGAGGPTSPPRPQPKAPDRAQTMRAQVTSVVDGDTLRVRPLERTRRSSYAVRLIGIDTPETKRPGTPVECGGPQATSSLTRLANRRRVVLVTDPNQDLFDRYDRLLAYVRLPGGRNANRAQIARGWSRVYVYDTRFRHYASFAAAERSARAARRGVWERCGGRFHRAR